MGQPADQLHSEAGMDGHTNGGPGQGTGWKGRLHRPKGLEDEDVFQEHPSGRTGWPEGTGQKKSFQWFWRKKRFGVLFTS